MRPKPGLVLASLGDLNRPSENISMSQCASLVLTGVIWARYSVVIIPKVYSLLGANVFMASTNMYNLIRAYKYQLCNKDKTKKVHFTTFENDEEFLKSIATLVSTIGPEVTLDFDLVEDNLFRIRCNEQ